MKTLTEPNETRQVASVWMLGHVGVMRPNRFSPIADDEEWTEPEAPEDVVIGKPFNMKRIDPITKSKIQGNKRKTPRPRSSENDMFWQRAGDLEDEKKLEQAAVVCVAEA